MKFYHKLLFQTKISTLYYLSAFLLAFLFADGLRAQDNKQVKKDYVRMGALASTVMGIDLKDADAAFKIWTDTFTKRLKAKKVFDFTFEYKMYDNVEDLKKDINSGYINYFNVSTEAYYQLDLNSDFIPFLSGTNHPSQNFTYYYLVTSVKNNIKDLKQLEGKKICISRFNEHLIGSYWIKSLVRDEVGAALYKTINFQTINQNENEDLLSVFFNKSDYAVISQSAFDIACELNPEIRKRIKILRSSGPVVNGLFVYRKGINPNTVKAIKEIALDIHLDNEGKQILNLFKIHKIISITKDDLIECENIITKYNKYFKK